MNLSQKKVWEQDFFYLEKSNFLFLLCRNDILNGEKYKNPYFKK
jgi:hypothetical protein